MTDDTSRFIKLLQRIAALSGLSRFYSPPTPRPRSAGTLRAAPLRRLSAYLRPALVLLALAVALLGLTPADSALAQQDPAPVKITSSPETGDTYGKGEKIVVAVTFSEPLTVTGKPQLRLAIGDKKRWARYDRSAKKGARLIFSYKVKSADEDDDGVSIKKNQLKLNGGGITDADGKRVRLKQSALPDQAGHKVDGSPPKPTPTPTPAPPANSKPQFAADTAARSVAENSAAGESVGDPVTATYGGGDTLTYALTGSDDFTINNSGQIMVASGATLDYETTKSYSVTVTVHDGKNAEGAADTGVDDSIDVTISVTNVDEPGTVALDSETPLAGSELTATLTDPDGSATVVAWVWERSADRTTWTVIAGATQTAYTPVADDAGKYLRATASYADGEGSGKRARAATANKVDDGTPRITSVEITSTPANGYAYSKGETMEVTVTFSEPVSGARSVWSILYPEEYSSEGALVAIVVQMDIPVPGTHIFLEELTETTWTFKRGVKGCERASNGISIPANGIRSSQNEVPNMIKDADGNIANLDHPALPADPAHKVHATCS